MSTIAQRKEVAWVAVLIPAFCEGKTVGQVVDRARRHLLDVIVVDDASTDSTALCAANAGALVIRRETNGGKGAALRQGFQHILAKGFDAVITLDADGFHDPDEIPKFLEAYQRTHFPVLVGNRMAELRRIPMVRRWTIRLMRYCLDRLLGVYVPDPPCGFRFYRCDVLPFLLAESESSSLPSEFETLLNVASRRIRVGSVRVTKQPKRHKSLLAPFRDLFRFFKVVRKYHDRIKPRRATPPEQGEL
jgi:glycosyltransferase involved in cell wall biosynthesis